MVVLSSGSYAVSIIWQHALHRYLVFGAEGDYWYSLLMTYATYSTSLLLSTALNYGLVEYLRLSSSLAWVLSLASTGQCRKSTFIRISWMM